jgi:hypothetical protein
MPGVRHGLDRFGRNRSSVAAASRIIDPDREIPHSEGERLDSERESLHSGSPKGCPIIAGGRRPRKTEIDFLVNPKRVPAFAIKEA